MSDRSPLKRLACVVSLLVATAATPACGARSELGTLPIPRLLAPLSTSMVTTRRPQLRWTLDGGEPAPAAVEICADRACHSVLATMRTAGTSATPEAELPPGVVYWRVRVSSGDEHGSTSSATWEVNVPKRGAPVGTSWGTVLDVDGDGLADVAVGAPREPGMGAAGMPGRVYLYRGGLAGLDEPPLVLSSPDAGPTDPIAFEVALGQFGVSVASAGDVDGDGYADLLVGAPCFVQWPATCTGHVYLFRGGPSGPSTIPSTILTAPSSLTALNADSSGFGLQVGSAGDVNGDGYADVIVVEDPGPDGAARASVYLGGPGGLAATPAVSLLGADDALVQKLNTPYWDINSFAAAADLNGDGYADLLLSGGVTPESDTLPASSQVYTFLGGPDGLSATPSATLNGGSETLGEQMAVLGDVDGDGFPDVAIWRAACGVPSSDPACGPERIGIHRGGPAGISPAPATIVTPPQDTAALLKPALSMLLTGPGDVDGDGYADLAVFMEEVHSGQVMGSTYLYRGGPSGISPAAPLVVPAPGGAPSFLGGVDGVRSGVTGDVDGDGFFDILIHAISGSVLLYRGASTGVEPTPIAITGGTLDGGFGEVVTRTVPGHRLSGAGRSGSGVTRAPIVRVP